jgi:hypothetical protein
MPQRTDSSLPPDDEPTADEPTRIDLGRRDFAGAGEFAADQRRQNKTRGEGLGAGGSDNQAARHPDAEAEDDLD